MLPVESQVQGVLCQYEVLRQEVVGLGKLWLLVLGSWYQSSFFIQTCDQ